MAASDTNTLVPQSDRPVPAFMAEPLNHLAFTLRSGELILVIALMFVCYAIVILRAHELSARSVITAVGVLTVLVMVAPPLFSTDLFSYQAYAKMFAIYGTNPYVNGPYTISLDPLFPYIGAKWIYTPSVYGPLFTLLSAGLAHASISLAEHTYKAAAAISSLGICWLIWRCARLRDINPVPGLALFGLNPLVVLYAVGGGHNDLEMLLLTTAGVYAVLRRRDTTAGSLIALGAGIKLTGLLVAPFAFAAEAPPAPPRRRRALLVGVVVTGAALAAIGFLCFGSGLLHMPGTLESVQNENPWGSLPGVLSAVIGGSASHIVGIAFGLICIALAIWLLRLVWLGRLDWIEAAAWTTVALLVTASSVLPWYGAWLLPLVALSRDHRLWKAALVLTSVMGLLTIAGYVPGGAFFGI